MKWTTELLMQYFRKIGLVIEFKGGVTGEDLEKALHEEAVERLNRVRNTIYNNYMDDSEKVRYIREQIVKEE